MTKTLVKAPFKADHVGSFLRTTPLEEASEYIPLENLSLSPQCGFASTEEGNELTEEEQWNKIKHVIQIAQDIWEAN